MKLFCKKCKLANTKCFLFKGKAVLSPNFKVALQLLICLLYSRLRSKSSWKFIGVLMVFNRNQKTLHAAIQRCSLDLKPFSLRRFSKSKAVF